MLYHIRDTYICGRGRIFQSDVIIFKYSFYIFITLKRKSLVYFAYEPVIILPPVTWKGAAPGQAALWPPWLRGIFVTMRVSVHPFGST